jgi:hypothetical protein
MLIFVISVFVHAEPSAASAPPPASLMPVELVPALLEDPEPLLLVEDVPDVETTVVFVRTVVPVLVDVTTPPSASVLVVTRVNVLVVTWVAVELDPLVVESKPVGLEVPQAVIAATPRVPNAIARREGRARPFGDVELRQK